jgi:hypothetical protein
MINAIIRCSRKGSLPLFDNERDDKSTHFAITLVLSSSRGKGIASRKAIAWAIPDETRSPSERSCLISFPDSGAGWFCLNDLVVKTNHPCLEGRCFYQLQLRPVREALKEWDATT